METIANEKIKYLNLGTLRKYACGKVSGSSEWYLKCLDCPSIGDCQVGTRAKELLEARTSNSSDKKVDKARKRAEDILEGCKTPVDIIRHYVDIRGVYPSTSILYRWRMDYPDIAKKYPIHEAELIMSKAARNGEKLIFPNEPKPAEEKEESDEISVDDFLKENEKPAVKEVIDIPENVAIPVEALKPISEKDFMKDRLQEKHDELMKKRGDLLIQISSLNTEIEVVDRMMECIEFTARAFGFSIDP